MRDFLSSKVKEIKPSGIRKFFDIASQIEGCISLGVGEPDFDTPRHICEEGIYALNCGNTFYTSNKGLIELRKEISKFMERKYNLTYDYSANILVTIGGSEAIDIALRTMIEPGDEVIIPTPCYVSYEPCAILSGATIKNVILNKENNFKLTPNDLKSAITPKSKILLINFPNNPTGATMNKSDLEKIASICIKHDLFVISDEIYSELSYYQKHISIASIPGMIERTIVINGFSKTYSMTGWRIGFACGPSDIISQMTKIHQFCIMCAPTISQYAAIEALKSGDLDIKNMKKAYNERRKYLLRRFKAMELPCFSPSGAFYVFPEIRKFGMTSEEFALRLLKEQKVVVVPGNAFGESGEGYVRISYAHSLENLNKALERLELFIKKYKR